MPARAQGFLILDRLVAAGLAADGPDELRLTPAGREVLAGRSDRALAPGFDRWIGGVHLAPPAAWRLGSPP